MNITLLIISTFTVISGGLILRLMELSEYKKTGNKIAVRWF